MTVSSTAKGSCWTTSIASRRSDAYRCMAGNTIYDPCFTLGSRNVVCPDGLRPKTGVRLSLTEALPAPQRGNARNVWMMVLANGVTCNIGTGTTIPLFPYYCTGNWACAAPRRSGNAGVLVAECGQPKSATEVMARQQFRVARTYE